MNIYDAIVKAADHIEKHPEQFNYGIGRVPECGTKACAAGWIGFFLGVPTGDDMVNGGVCERVLGIPYDEFDSRMDQMSLIEGSPDFYEWMYDATVCAKSLRRYAETYHATAPVTA